MSAADLVACSRTVGAFRVCEHGHDITYRAVVEWNGPDAVAALVRAGHRAGAIHGPRDHGEAASGCPRQHCGVLDLLDEAGDITGGWCIPTPEAWAWWTRAVELRVSSSDCHICETAVDGATQVSWSPRSRR